MFEVRFHNVALVAFATALFATGCDDDNDLDDIEPPPPGEVPPSETPSVSGFRVFKKQGDTWQPGADLRALSRVEILK